MQRFAARSMLGVVGALIVWASVGTVPVSAQSPLVTWQATERWRVDGTENGEPFADLRDFVIGKDGALWALDFKDQAIRRYDMNGKPLSQVGRKGDGPGELRKSNGLVVQRDGTVWVVDPSNSRLTVFDASGKFLRQHANPSSGYGYRWEAWIDRNTGDLVDQFVNPRTSSTGGMDWRRVSISGVVRDTLTRPGCGRAGAPVFDGYRGETKGKGNMMGQYPFTYGGGAAPDGYGSMWCATSSSTRVALVRIGKNDTIATTSVVVRPVPVAKAERDEQISVIRKALATYETSDFDPSKIPNAKPGIASLAVDDDGRLWVQHAARYGEQAVTFDVHDRTGKHLGRLRIPQAAALQALPVRARGNTVWFASRDNDDVLSIVQYTIRK